MNNDATYSALGIHPVINAYATLTRLGGSVMPSEVVQAMSEASTCFVDLELLQSRVGEEIAKLTNNEAAYVSSGAAAGLTLATAACVAGTDPELSEKIPNLEHAKNEVIMQKLHRNGYDYAVRQVGVHIVEIGDMKGTTKEELQHAIGDKTAAVFWFQGAMNRSTELPLEEVISIAHAQAIPVIVDAAAQLPPVENLWRFTKMGADLAIFSGGKDLAGPQSSGLVLGRRDLIEACRKHGNPHQGVGRPMKVGKEELMGCFAAVRRYTQLDHQARMQEFEERVTRWNQGLQGIDNVQSERDFPNEAGQPVPWSLVSFPSSAVRDAVVKNLMDGEPMITVALSGENAIHLNPMTLKDGEAEIVLDRLEKVIREIG